MLKQSLSPVARKDARILILGSMPGERSLAEQQYYAHPHNLFWPFIENILGIERELPYAKRLQGLRQNHIALWDVLRECERKGSLDQHIRHEKPNDFVTFLREHPQINRIGFNGRKAHDVFVRLVARQHAGLLDNMQLELLPSTSAANASISRQQKQQAWIRFLRP